MKHLTCIVLLVLSFLITAKAQTAPPVLLNIPNITQQTPMWCWAAVVQQILNVRIGAAQTPPQCALVAIANGAHPSACCSSPNSACIVGGSFPQIAGLLANFGGVTSSYALPANAMTLYQTLASGRPILLHVASGISSSHVVVLRGMSFAPTPYGVQPILHINDPMSHYTQPIAFSQLMPVWLDALVIN